MGGRRVVHRRQCRRKPARRRCAGAFRRSVRTGGGGGGGVSTLANVGRTVKEAVRCEARERMCADVVASGRRPIPYSAKFALPLGGILHVDVRRHDVRACNLPQCALGPHTVWRLRKGIYTVFRRGFVSGGVRRYPFCRRVDAPSHFVFRLHLSTPKTLRAVDGEVFREC